MKALAIATIAVGLLGLSLPASAHMNCGWQWPNDDVYANSVYPTFSGTDCEANRLNSQVLMNNGGFTGPMIR